MAKTLLDTAEDMLRHVYLERNNLPPVPDMLTGQAALRLADKHYRLNEMIKELAYFIDEWATLTGQQAQIVDPNEPTDEEVQTAIQSIKGATS